MTAASGGGPRTAPLVGAVAVALVALALVAFVLLRPTVSAASSVSAAAAPTSVAAARTGVVCPAEASATLPEAVGSGLLVASNQRVHIAVCSAASGALYYYGADDRTHLTITLPADRSGSGFTATDNGVTYSIAPDHLLVAKAGRTLEEEDLTSGWVG